MYRALYGRLLSRFDAERIHHAAVHGLQIAGSIGAARALLRRLYRPPDEPRLHIRAFGLEFAHPLGLAAGFDKDARCLPALEALGFSSVEVGTVTPHAQPGNPKPRLFRLMPDDGLINRLGFPSDGMKAVGTRLTTRPSGYPIGLSLGKNQGTPLIEAARDYSAVLCHLYGRADFFVVNISSPNTPELRKLQTRAYLDDLLTALNEALDRAHHAAGNAASAEPKPLLIKIAPDLDWDAIDTITDLALKHAVSGLVATNTTLSRPDTLRGKHRTESGGLSGAPLRDRADAIIRHIYRHTEGGLPIIGVGGVFTSADVWAKLAAGATLVQSYTGFIFEGPAFVRRAIHDLRARMDRAGIRHITEVIGSAANESGRKTS